MEYNYRIKRNDYVIENELRRDVVQMILDSIEKFFEKHVDLNILLKDIHYVLYLHISYVGTSDMFTCYGCGENYIHIRTSEMRVVFRVLQDAGYYIYSEYNKYTISKSPYSHGQRINVERTEFKHFLE